MSGRRRQGSRSAGIVLMNLMLVLLVGLSGCAGSELEATGSTEGSTTSSTIGSTTAEPWTDIATEVSRQVYQYLNALGDYFDPVESVGHPRMTHLGAAPRRHEIRHRATRL